MLLWSHTHTADLAEHSTIRYDTIR